MPNFSSILDKAPSSTEKPKPIPQGSYYTVIQGQPRYDKSSKKGTEFVEFQAKITSPGDDVDPDELKAWATKADGTTRDLNSVVLKLTYYTTDDAMWRLKDFLIHVHGEDPVEEAETYRPLIEECSNMAVGVYVKHRPSQDGTSVFAEAGSTFAME